MNPPRIVVAVNDSRLRFLVIQRLKDLNVAFTINSLTDSVCEVAPCIITDGVDDLPPSHLVIVDAPDDIESAVIAALVQSLGCLLYTSPSPRD